jgi:hypothetical protein
MSKSKGKRAKRPDTCAVCGQPEPHDCARCDGRTVKGKMCFNDYDQCIYDCDCHHAFVSASGLKRTVKPENAHAVYEDDAAGWTWYVLKVYQSLDKGRCDPYARAFCKVTSPMTGAYGDLGDVYIRDIGGRLVRGVEVR